MKDNSSYPSTASTSWSMLVGLSMDDRYPGSVSDYPISYRILSVLSDVGYPDPITYRIFPLNQSETDWDISFRITSDIRLCKGVHVIFHTLC